MNYELFIAKRIIKGKPSHDKRMGIISTKPIIRIAIAGVVLGLAVMIVSVAIVTGFQKQIRDKIIGFGGHILVSNFEENNSYEVTPMEKKPALYKAIRSIKGVRGIQEFATKAGIIKTGDEIQGVVLKGAGTDFDWNFFKDKIINGNAFSVDADTGKAGNDVLVSKQIASKLKLKTGDHFVIYFAQQPPRIRKFRISGIYETGLDDFDKIFVLCDIRHIKKLAEWNNNQTGGLEILLNDFNDLDKIEKEVYGVIGYNLNAKTIKERFPQIFDWLDLQNINVIIIISLMILVAGINMISALLIIILERTQMIGILKSLGAQSWSIRKIFIYTSTYLAGMGLLIGNIVGIALCLIQLKTGIITLPQESYYMPVVPINLSWSHILMLNAGTMLACVLMMILPSYIITKIRPIKALRFD